MSDLNITWATTDGVFECAPAENPRPVRLGRGKWGPLNDILISLPLSTLVGKEGWSFIKCPDARQADLCATSAQKYRSQLKMTLNDAEYVNIEVGTNDAGEPGVWLKKVPGIKAGKKPAEVTG